MAVSEREFWALIQRKMPPMRTQRWSCDLLKKAPSKNVPLKYRLMGIRAEESVRRASRPRGRGGEMPKVMDPPPLSENNSVIPMVRNFNTNTDNNDEWLTPPEILRALGPFDLDPAAPIVRPWDMAARHYTKIDDGMSQPWEGRV